MESAQTCLLSRGKTGARRQKKTGAKAKYFGIERHIIFSTEGSLAMWWMFGGEVYVTFSMKKRGFRLVICHLTSEAWKPPQSRTKKQNLLGVKRPFSEQLSEINKGYSQQSNSWKCIPRPTPCENHVRIDSQSNSRSNSRVGPMVGNPKISARVLFELGCAPRTRSTWPHSSQVGNVTWNTLKRGFGTQGTHLQNFGALKASGRECLVNGQGGGGEEEEEDVLELVYSHIGKLVSLGLGSDPQGLQRNQAHKDSHLCISLASSCRAARAIPAKVDYPAQGRETTTRSPRRTSMGKNHRYEWFCWFFQENHMDQRGRKKTERKTLQPVPVRRFIFPAAYSAENFGAVGRSEGGGGKTYRRENLARMDP